VVAVVAVVVVAAMVAAVMVGGFSWTSGHQDFGSR